MHGYVVLVAHNSLRRPEYLLVQHKTVSSRIPETASVKAFMNRILAPNCGKRQFRYQFRHYIADYTGKPPSLSSASDNDVAGTTERATTEPVTTTSPTGTQVDNSDTPHNRPATSADGVATESVPEAAPVSAPTAATSSTGDTALSNPAAPAATASTTASTASKASATAAAQALAEPELDYVVDLECFLQLQFGVERKWFAVDPSLPLRDALKGAVVLEYLDLHVRVRRSPSTDSAKSPATSQEYPVASEADLQAIHTSLDANNVGVDSNSVRPLVPRDEFKAAAAAAASPTLKADTQPSSTTVTSSSSSSATATDATPTTAQAGASAAAAAAAAPPTSNATSTITASGAHSVPAAGRPGRMPGMTVPPVTVAGALQVPQKTRAFQNAQ